MIRAKKFFCYFGNTIICYLLALWLKTYILKNVLGKEFTDSSAFFSLSYVKNDGAAFNLFSGYQDLLTIFALLIILQIIVYLVKSKLYVSEKFIMLLSFFSAGILGNAVERFTQGYVEDFIKINIFDFPVFNLNDIMITIGAIVLAFVIIRDKTREIKENKDVEEDMLYKDI